MQRLSKLLILVLMTTLITSHLVAQTDLNTRRRQLNSLLQEEWEYTLKTHPELATHAGDNRYNDRLSDHSAEFYAREVEHDKEALKRFEAIDTTGFPEQERLNKILMVR